MTFTAAISRGKDSNRTVSALASALQTPLVLNFWILHSRRPGQLPLDLPWGDNAVLKGLTCQILTNSSMTISPEHAFQVLVGVLSTRGNQVLEIEIIPPSLGLPFIQDGCSIGISKKTLVQAFTVARQRFIKHLIAMSADDFTGLLEENIESDGVPDSVITEIMLLFDCEHLTACNWRKRRLLAAVAHCPNAPAMLETELTLMATYQRSPLHRHTKSPTLWSHRLWVLRQLFQIKPWNKEALVKLERAELDVVLRAGELHPKNYYAFSYMRHLHAVLSSMSEDLQCHSDWTSELTQPLVAPMLNWCLAHPKDISGWIFGKYLLDNVPNPQTRVDAITRVLRFAREVGWEGESLWTFIDQTVRHYGLENVIDDTLRHSQAVSASSARGCEQHMPEKWPWKAQLEKVRVYWTQYGQSNNVQ